MLKYIERVRKRGARSYSRSRTLFVFAAGRPSFVPLYFHPEKSESQCNNFYWTQIFKARGPGLCIRRLVNLIRGCVFTQDRDSAFVFPDVRYKFFFLMSNQYKTLTDMIGCLKNCSVYLLYRKKRW